MCVYIYISVYIYAYIKHIYIHMFILGAFPSQFASSGLCSLAGFPAFACKRPLSNNKGKMAQPILQQQMGQDGKLMGARMPPTCLSLCCHPCNAISGYETGDPTDGSMSGNALISCLLCFFCGLGWIHALLCWKPDPSMIKGDGTMRTLNNKCLAVCCVGGPCAIAF